MRALLSCTCWALLLPSICLAEAPTEPEPSPDSHAEAPAKPRDWFNKGDWEGQFLSGYYPTSGLGSGGIAFAAGPDGKALPTQRIYIDLVPIQFRIGYTPVCALFDGTILRGNSEFLLEWAADPITREYGNYMTGPSLLIRHNFQPKGWRLVPYGQVGAGILLNDAYHNQEQRLIGGPSEFLLQAELGLHYFINHSCSIDAEGGYQHVSNADTYRRNVGINNVGGSIGFSYHFGACGR
jgi:hypothetical protein